MNEQPRILIVDDEPIVQRSFDRLLSGAHCCTRTANDGAEALQAMDRESFDVVLLDLRMPGEDGISVLRKIKTGWPQSEVVVITGYPSIESAKQAVRAGASDYLAKPVEAQDMICATRRALSRQQWTLRRVQDARDCGAGTKAEFCNTEGESDVATS
jgi:DNA-binding NtrC family response regulator